MGVRGKAIAPDTKLRGRLVAAPASCRAKSPIARPVRCSAYFGNTSAFIRAIEPAQGFGIL